MNENEKIENHENHAEMTVGEILRNARTTGRRKREIPTISKQLCIREEFLQALEDGNYSVIPETVYILGFARNYAMELGLDPDEIVNKLKREMGLEHHEDDDDVKPKSESTEDGSKAASGDNNAKSWVSACVKFIRRNWIWFAVGIGTAIVVGAVAVFLLIGGAGENESPLPSANTDVVQTGYLGEPEYNVPVRERFGIDSAETASVILQATEDAWVQVKDARGNEVFGRALVQGDIYYVPDGDGYTAVFGNAGGVDIWVNGVLAPKQGGDHVRVADIALTPEKLLPAAE